MRKTRFFVGIALVICTLFSSACTKKEAVNDHQEQDDGIKSIYVMKKEYDMLMDFENASDVKKGIVFENQFGRVTICDDVDYITNGKASAKLEIIGDLYGKTEAYPAMEFILDRAPILKSDLSAYAAIEYDVFNASDRDLNLYTSLGSFTKKLYNNAAVHLLKKGEWTHVIVYLPTEVMGGECPLAELTSLYVWFDKPGKGETSPVLYMDSLMARKADGANPIKMTEREAGVIADFENDWEMYGIYAKGAYNYKSNPALNINTNLEYVSRGNKSLRVYTKKPFDGVSPYFGYPTLIFDREKFPGISEIGNCGGFSLDIMNRANERRKISMQVRDADGKCASYWNMNLNADCWTTIECTVPELKEYGVDVDQIVSVDLLWEEEGYSESDLELYIDNFVLKGEN